jgi:uncharacterized membrane protein YeaQ/YmgE (transglycosylase-associated protein family)
LAGLAAGFVSGSAAGVFAGAACSGAEPGFTCSVFAGLAGAVDEGAFWGAFCAQTAAAETKSKRAGANLRPKDENAVIFLIMQGIPHVPRSQQNV